MRMYGRVAPGIGISVGPLGIAVYVLFVLPVVAAIWLVMAIVQVIAWLIERASSRRS